MSEAGLKPKSDCKFLSLEHYTLLHLRKVIQTHIFFQKHSRQQGHFKTQVPPGNLSHLSKFLAQLIYKSPLSIISSPSHFFLRFVTVL